jgi:hypothetical protein
MEKEALIELKDIYKIYNVGDTKFERTMASA